MINRSIAGPRITAPWSLDVQFCEVMDTAPVMIWVSDEDKGCVWFNRPWLVFTGRSMAQEIGNGWAGGVHEDDFDDCLRIYTSHFDARTDFRMQYRLRRHDRAYRWIDDTGIPRFARDGTFLGYIGSCIDVHEHRETQSELRRRLLEVAQLNREVDAAALAASIAHEVKQPLTAIIANANAGLHRLASETPDIDEARELLNIIVDNGHRANRIIEDIRSMFQKDRQINASLNLNELIQESLALVDSDLQLHNVVVRTDLLEPMPRIVADRGQLQLVMLNLIKNAIDAMEVAAENSRLLHLTTKIENSHNLTITVRDSGSGIDVANIERVFDRFFTTKSRGMGMGLSICRSIIEAHNGRIWAESAPCEGHFLEFYCQSVASDGSLGPKQAWREPTYVPIDGGHQLASRPEGAIAARN